MNIWGITHPGVVRQENQDALYVEQLGERQVLGVVCDGMGGARAGNVASALAVETFRDSFHDLWQSRKGLDAAVYLSTSAEQANAAVNRRSETESACYGMGTTMVALLADGAHVTILNEGDSRAYRVNENGIECVTRDHSLVQDLVDRGELTQEEAKTHPNKNLITRALGSEPELNADLFELQAQPGEFFLLCSDGLSNLLSDQEILYEIIHGGEAEDCCRRLLEIAIRRGAPDNVTAVLIQC